MKSIADGRATRLVTVQATRYVVLSMNTTQPPLSDKRVRQAMHYALDVAAIIKNLYAGMGKPFSGGVADTDFGYNAALKPYPYDPGRAKILLTQAGYGGGVDLTVHAGTGTMVNDKALIETIVDMWSRVGIHHEPLVLHPFHEAIGARADRAARQLLDAVVGGEARGQDLRAHLGHAHRDERVGLLGDDANHGRVGDLDGLDGREARRHHRLARLQVPLERGLDVLGGERRPVVELHALPERELPRRLVDVLPRGGEPRLELERGVPPRQRVVEVDEVVHGEDLGRAPRIHGGGLGRLRDHEVRGLGRRRCRHEEQGERGREDLHWFPPAAS